MLAELGGCGVRLRCHRHIRRHYAAQLMDGIRYVWLIATSQLEPDRATVVSTHGESARRGSLFSRADSRQMLSSVSFPFPIDISVVNDHSTPVKAFYNQVHHIPTNGLVNTWGRGPAARATVAASAVQTGNKSDSGRMLRDIAPLCLDSCALKSTAKMET